jgi:hypothetical protein
MLSEFGCELEEKVRVEVLVPFLVAHLDQLDHRQHDDAPQQACEMRPAELEKTVCNLPASIEQHFNCDVKELKKQTDHQRGVEARAHTQ